MKIKYIIYKLVDPTDNRIRYIGLTFNSLKMRLKSHLSEPGKSHKIYWIKKLKKMGLSPIIESVESDISTYEEACEKEIYYIEYFRSLGCDLTNMASGGNKNKKMSLETRNKMSESAKNRNFKLVLSDEIKDILRRKSISRFEDPNERDRLRISNKRYEDSKTPEQKLKDILVQKNKWIIQYDKEMNFIQEFPSIGEAVRKTGVYRSNISKCCSMKIKSAGGFIWRYK